MLKLAPHKESRHKAHRLAVGRRLLLPLRPNLGSRMSGRRRLDARVTIMLNASETEIAICRENARREERFQHNRALDIHPVMLNST